MPKKHHKPHFSKPLSTTHSSLTTSPHPASASTTSSSVNDLLTNLRRAQIASHDERGQRQYGPGSTRTVHPSLRALLDVADTPPPRPRPGMRPAPGARRGPAGPPPPSSWLSTSKHAPAHVRKQARMREQEGPRPNRLDRLPGLELPEECSLRDLTLVHLARDWDFHVEYDQHYLAALPACIKSALLAYIAVHGPAQGIDREGLKTLFRSPEEVEDATSSDEITHLDLSGAIGRTITLKQLGGYWTLEPHTAPSSPAPKTPQEPSSAPLRAATDEPSCLDVQPHDIDEVEDSWEQQADALTSPQSSLATTRFPHLTHLSLSHPHPTVSWSRFLAFAPQLVTLTHLSLAHWPAPCLTPNSKTATTSSSHSGAPVSFGASDFYSDFDGDWSEGAGVLWRLSRATYCLKWLDLEGCGGWVNALEWQGAGAGHDEWEPSGADWTGGWRGIETVVVAQGGPRPEAVEPTHPPPVQEWSSIRPAPWGGVRPNPDAADDDEERDEEEKDRARRAVRATILQNQRKNQSRQTRAVCERIHAKRRNAGLSRIRFDIGENLTG